MIELSECVSCEDNFYNGANTIGVKQCWHRTKSKMSKYLVIGKWQNPPYDKTALVSKPECWHAKDVVKIKPEALDHEGYWRG